MLRKAFYLSQGELVIKLSNVFYLNTKIQKREVKNKVRPFPTKRRADLSTQKVLIILTSTFHYVPTTPVKIHSDAHQISANNLTTLHNSKKTRYSAINRGRI